MLLLLNPMPQLLLLRGVGRASGGPVAGGASARRRGVARGDAVRGGRGLLEPLRPLVLRLLLSRTRERGGCRGWASRRGGRTCARGARAVRG